jgi:hypothetical protein
MNQIINLIVSLTKQKLRMVFSLKQNLLNIILTPIKAIKQDPVKELLKFLLKAKDRK